MPTPSVRHSRESGNPVFKLFLKGSKAWIPAFAGMTTSVSILLTVALVLSACGGSRSRLKLGQTDAGEVVEAIGYAPNDPSDVIQTKRASLVDAQKNAVEKAVGVFVSGRTMVEKAVAIENNILARTEGYVKKYDIVSEGPEKDLYKTRIRALVAIKDLEADLKEMSLLDTPQMHRPRVSIQMSESINQVDTKEKVAQTALEKVLGENGYIVVNSSMARSADLAIVGKAASFPFQAEGLGGFVSYRARISLQVNRSGTEDVVTSYTKEASGLGGNQQLAGFKSLETVGELAGGELAQQLSTMGKSKSILVFFEGVKSFQDVERMRKHLMSQPGVADLMLRLYDEEMAQFDVQLKSILPADLASALDNSRTLPLKVVESSSQVIRVHFE